MSVEQNIVNFVIKLKKLCNITAISAESVKCDSQLMDNPNVHGVEYQHGTLFGYEVRQYLLEKYGHSCQYCGGESEDNEINVEHIISRKNNGSDSIKNLNLCCRTCNEDKGSLNLNQWLNKLKSSKKTKLSQTRIARIEKILQGKRFVPRRYAAWVNSYKCNLVDDLRKLTDSLELASGGRTMFNRINKNLPKEHYYDALNVGQVPEEFKFKTNIVLHIKACGRGSRFRGRTNSCGIITNLLPRQKSFFGFQTGDLVKATVDKGKKQGVYSGRAAVRSSGYFNIKTQAGVIQGIKYECCKIVQRADGYSYSITERNKSIIS